MLAEETLDRDYQAAFAKGLSVIEAFDRSKGKLTISEVAALTGLSRASARRSLLTLVKLGYAEFDGKFFQLMPRILRLGYAYLWSTTVPQVIQPFLERLSEATHESCSASTLDGTDIVYIARSAQRRIMSIGLSVGSRVPAFCASMGRVLLSYLAPAELDRVLTAEPLKPLTRRTVTDPVRVKQLIEQVRLDGYAVIDQEVDLGLRSISVPILNIAGVPVAAMNFSVQVERMSVQDMINNLLPKLRETQANLRSVLR